MKKLKILSLTLLIIVALSMINTVNAAIAIKEAKDMIYGGTMPEYYYMSQQMKDAGQGLEGVNKNVDVHLATCSEFALLYNLMISNYGVGYEDFNNNTIEINGNSHTTSNRKSIRSDGLKQIILQVLGCWICRRSRK